MKLMDSETNNEKWRKRRWLPFPFVAMHMLLNELTNPRPRDGKDRARGLLIAERTTERVSFIFRLGFLFGPNSYSDAVRFDRKVNGKCRWMAADER